LLRPLELQDFPSVPLLRIAVCPWLGHRAAIPLRISLGDLPFWSIRMNALAWIVTDRHTVTTL